MIIWFVGGDTLNNSVGGDAEKECGGDGGGHVADGLFPGNKGGNIEVNIVDGEVGFSSLFVKFGTIDAGSGSFVAAVVGGGGFGRKSREIIEAGIVTI